MALVLEGWFFRDGSPGMVLQGWFSRDGSSRMASANPEQRTNWCQQQLNWSLAGRNFHSF